MKIDKPTLAKLKKFANAFKTARERNANESDTVMYLVRFFDEVLGWDPLSGELTKEFGVKERYCDFAVLLEPKIEGCKPEFLIEAKAASIKNLNPKHIEQAENYASRTPINWVLLTNGIEWQFYHLEFAQDSGITDDLVFALNFVEELEKDPDLVWDTLSVLAKSNVQDGSLETYYEQKKLLSPKAIVNTLLGEAVLTKIRQELNRQAPARLDIKSVFHAVMQVLTAEAVAAAGDILPPLKKKRHHRHRVSDKTEQPEQPEQPASPMTCETAPQATAQEEIPT